MDDGRRLVETVVNDLNQTSVTLNCGITLGVAFVAGLTIVRIIQRYRWGRCPGRLNMQGKTVVITGANSGIGRATALEMAKHSARVILACRNSDAAQSAVEYIRKRTSYGELLPKHLDLSSFASIRSFVEDIKRNEPRLDVLINNAGVYGLPHQLSKDGFEMTFAVNHLGHFLLTYLLLDHLKDSASRVVVISSALYTMGKIDLDKPDSLSPYNPHQAYCNSKLANVLFGIELDRRCFRNTEAKVFIVSPGMVWSNLGRHMHMPWWKKLLMAPIVFFFVRTPNEGCQTILYCSTSDEINHLSGRYFRNCKVAGLKSDVADEYVAARLWNVCESLVT